MHVHAHKRASCMGVAGGAVEFELQGKMAVLTHANLLHCLFQFEATRVAFTGESKLCFARERAGVCRTLVDRTPCFTTLNMASDQFRCLKGSTHIGYASLSLRRTQLGAARGTSWPAKRGPQPLLTWPPKASEQQVQQVQQKPEETRSPRGALWPLSSLRSWACNLSYEQMCSAQQVCAASAQRTALPARGDVALWLVMEWLNVVMRK